MDATMLALKYFDPKFEEKLYNDLSFIRWSLLLIYKRVKKGLGESYFIIFIF